MDIAVNSRDALIVTALNRAGEPIAEGNLSLSSEPRVRSALVFYEQRFNHLLSVFPWSFAVKNEPLRQTSREGTRYRYQYEIPLDIKQVWEFSQSPIDVAFYGPYYIPTELYISHRFPNIPDTALGNQGAVIGDYIESNWETLYLFYTSDDRKKYRAYTEQFKSILISEVELDLWGSKNTQADDLAVRARLADEANRKDFANQSISGGKVSHSESVMWNTAVSRL